MRLGPAFVYTLTVHPAQLIWVRQLLKRIAVTVADNPFSPYVNLITDRTLELLEWYLSDGKTAWGTLGL